MTGTPNQIQLATLIKIKIAADFDRVEKALRETANGQPENFQSETKALIAILNEKRTQVLQNDRAGEFIRDWQELSGKVAQLVTKDPRYQAIRTQRDNRRLELARHSRPRQPANDSVAI